MKKKLLFLLLFLLMPVVVLADGMGPKYTSFQGVVTNPNGVTCTYDDGSTTFNYGDIVYIINEIVEDNKDMYMVANSNASPSSLCAGGNCFAPCHILTTDVTPKKYTKEEDSSFLKTELYVFREGVYLYNAPSTKYGKASETMIPVGTILKSNGVSIGNTTWTYARYGDIAGYVFVWGDDSYNLGLTSGVAEVYDDDKEFLFPYDTQLLDLPDGNPNGVIISKGNRLKPIAYFAFVIDGAEGPEYCYLFETEKGNGWVCDKKYLMTDVKKVLFIKDTELYSNDSDINYYGKEPIAVISANTFYDSLYVAQFEKSYEDYYYLMTDDVSGFFYYSSSVPTFIEYKDAVTIEKGKYDLYDTYNGNLLDTEISIKEGTTTNFYTVRTYTKDEVTCKETWYYLENENAWIKTDDENCITTEEIIEESEIEEPTVEENKMDTKTLVFIILGATLVLSATAAVIIILINKKKKNKNKKINVKVEETNKDTDIESTDTKEDNTK